MKNKSKHNNYSSTCVFFNHAPCFVIGTLFYVSFVWIQVYACAIYSMVSSFGGTNLFWMFEQRLFWIWNQFSMMKVFGIFIQFDQRNMSESRIQALQRHGTTHKGRLEKPRRRRENVSERSGKTTKSLYPYIERDIQVNDETTFEHNVR
jgi:hypothetical protein